jgi:hypothetical protein
MSEAAPAHVTPSHVILKSNPPLSPAVFDRLLSVDEEASSSKHSSVLRRINQKAESLIIYRPYSATTATPLA